MATKKKVDVMLTARAPATLVRALDKAAQEARRSRSAEVVLRLQASLKDEAKRLAA